MEKVLKRKNNMQIYNSLTKQKEIFKPIEENKVRLYSCGVTVYDYFHIGNGRMLIVFDMVVRYLRYRGYEVTYVQNITDIDDKIIKRAQEQNVDYHVITEKYIQALHEDRKALGLLSPDKEPRATEFVDKMINMIERLIEKKYAYVAGNGDVLYSIQQFKEYGKLSHRKIEDLQAGARIEVDEHKHNPLDFVLWKMAKPGEPSWDSPWGKGRPGWHIECSVMAEDCLAEQIDIHGGGMDLKFPHHENEIAQTEACTGKTFAKIWMHNGFLQIDNEKMSKSLGNFFTTREVLQKVSGEELRYFMLSAHYRQPINYAPDSLQNAKEALQRFYLALRDLDVVDDYAAVASSVIPACIDVEEEEESSFYEKRFCEAMDDDFNTPEALAVLFELVREINRAKTVDTEEAIRLAKILRKLAGVLGLLQMPAEVFLQERSNQQVDAEKIEKLIAARNHARQKKDWAEADRVRKELDELGVILEDSASGTTWRFKL